MATPRAILLGPNASAYMRELQKGGRRPGLLTNTKVLGDKSKYNLPGVFIQGAGYKTGVFTYSTKRKGFGLLAKADLMYKVPKMETIEVDMLSKQVQDSEELKGLGLTKRRAVRGETVDEILSLDYPEATEQDVDLLKKYTADGDWVELHFNPVQWKPGLMRPGAPASSMLKRLRWHEKNRIMEAAFNSNGAVVVYRQVPITVWAELKLCYEKGLSVGRAFWTLVRRADSRVGGQLVGNYVNDGWDNNPANAADTVPANIDGRSGADFDASDTTPNAPAKPKELSLQELKDLAYANRKKFIGNQDYLIMRGTDKANMAEGIARKLGLIDKDTRILSITETKERDARRAADEYDRRIGRKPD